MDAVWHFFKFRRVFGSLTLDRNTKFLEAGSKLKFFDFKITIQKYFKPNFKKNKFTLNENAELLNLNLKFFKLVCTNVFSGPYSFGKISGFDV